MTADDLVVLYELDPEPALPPVRLADCDLEFHRRRATRDIWCIAVGPLGAWPFPVVEHEMLARVRATGPDPLRPRGRPVAGLRVDIDDNVAIVMRARGQRLEGTYVYADGSPFGGFGGGLPSARRRTLREFIADLLSGRGGSPIQTFTAVDSAGADSPRSKP
jgi:hypothetical protein